MFDRRHFLAAASASTLLPSVGFAKGALAAEKADVVIIGGGLSGLNSAMMLGELGYKVVVLEAGPIVGGRVKTLDTSEGKLDVGASQIGRGYARVLDACMKLGLQLIPEDRDLLPFGFHYKGQWVDPKTWADNPLNQTVGDERRIPPLLMGQAVTAKWNPCKELSDWLDPKLADQDISLRQLMVQKGYSPAAIELASYSAPGIGIDETSMLRMWQEETRGIADRRFGTTAGGSGEAGKREHPFGEANDHNAINGLASINNVVGGCQQLPFAMAAKLGDVVRLNKRVGRITMSDKGASVTCLDGSTYQARFVISTLPFTMLRDVEITGSANPKARDAIAHMPYANTARLYLSVEKPFWKADGLPASFSTDGPIGMFWGIDNHTGEGKHRAMVVMVGKMAQAIAQRDDAVPFILSEIEAMRPASKGLMKVVAYKDWARDPLQKGCGFSLAPGQVNAFGRDFVKPWQVMHFAGEHTRRSDFGMESAMESSERVVLEIAERG